MTRRWVVNASPLILLGKAEQLWLLHNLATELVIPGGVAKEVAVRPEGERLLKELLAVKSVRLEDSGTIPQEVSLWDLGRGESEVLALALSMDESRAVIDDLEARRCAQALSVGVMGTLGVVLRAKRKGLIPAARPAVARLREVGLYASVDLVERALAHVDE